VFKFKRTEENKNWIAGLNQGKNNFSHGAPNIMKWMAGRKQFDVFVLYFLVSGTMRQEI